MLNIEGSFPMASEMMFPKSGGETYSCFALCNSHLSDFDFTALGSNEFPGVMPSENGFFIKLGADSLDDFVHLCLPRFEIMSSSFRDILTEAFQAGYRLVEFDSSAEEVKGLASFSW